MRFHNEIYRGSVINYHFVSAVRHLICVLPSISDAG